jgi:hypothetical protein
MSEYDDMVKSVKRFFGMMAILITIGLGVILYNLSVYLS